MAGWPVPGVTEVNPPVPWAVVGTEDIPAPVPVPAGAVCAKALVLRAKARVSKQNFIKPPWPSWSQHNGLPFLR